MNATRFLHPHIAAPAADNLDRAQRYLRVAFANGLVFSDEADGIQNRINIARKALEVFGEDVTRSLAMAVLEETEALLG